MTSDHPIWPLIEQIATLLDGDRESSESNLNELQARLREIPRHARDDIRRQMILIVAGLSRLEIRLIEVDGPLETAV